MTTEYDFIKNLDTPEKKHFLVSCHCALPVLNAVHILILQLLQHARSTPSLEDLLAKTKQHNGSALAPCSSATRAKDRAKIQVFFFLSFFLSFFLYQSNQGNHWSFHEGLGSSVCGICPLKHHWRKALAQSGEVLSCLVKPIFKSHAKVTLLLQSLQMTAQNQTEDIIKPNSSSYHFIPSKKHFPWASTSMLPSVLSTRSHIVLPLEYELLHSVIVLAVSVNETLALAFLHPLLTWGSRLWIFCTGVMACRKLLQTARHLFSKVRSSVNSDWNKEYSHSTLYSQC